MVPSDSNPPDLAPPAGEPSFEQLRAVHTLHADLVNTIDGIVWEGDALSTRFLFVSAQATRILGYPPEMWTGDVDFWPQHILQADRAEALAFHRKATQELRDHRFEYRMVAADGSIHWMRDIVTVVAEEGRPVRLRGIMVDATDRKRAEESLRSSQQNFETAFRLAPHAMSLTRAADHAFVDVNEGFLRTTGYTREEVLGRGSLELGLWVDPRAWRQAMQLIAEQGAFSDLEAELRLKDGRIINGLASGRVVDLGGTPCVLTVTQDITERKAAERELRRVNRALELSSRCSQLIARATDEEALLRQICRAVVETGGYLLAWVGYAEQDAERTVRPVAHGGRNDGYLETARIAWSDGVRGREPVGTAIRTGLPVLTRDTDRDPGFAPWRQEAALRGFASILALPLLAAGVPFGSLAVHAGTPDAFDANETRLLCELADSLAAGIRGLRSRQERRRAEEALKASESRLLSIFESEPECVKIVASDGTLLDMNPAGLAMLEVDRKEDAIGQPLSKWVAPECQVAFEGIAERVFKGESVTGHFEIIGQRGARRWMETHAVPMRDSQSAITSLIAVTRDITGRQFAERVREATYSIAEAALSSSELQVLFRCVHQIIRGLLPAENFYIALYDPTAGMVSFPYFVDQFDAPPAPRLFARGLTELVIRTGQAQLLSDENRAALTASGELESFGAESLAWLGIPLRGSGGVLGALVVQSYGEGHVYTPAERDMLSFVSGQVAMAIERKRAEGALRESEARQRALFETMGEGVVYQDAQGSIILANSAAERILGLSLEQMMGRSSTDPHWACIHPDGTEFPGQEHPAMVALRTGHPVRDVLMGIFHAEEGRHRWAVVNAVPEFRPGEDRPYQVFATITEVTEIKRIQDELRVTEPRLRTVLSNSPAVIYQLDREGRFLLSEGKGLEALGLKPGQVVGLSALEVYRDSAETVAQLRRSLAGEFIRGQLEVQGVVFDNLLTPIRNDQGEVESVIGIATDITERVRAERALRDSEERFRGVFENSTIGIYRTTLEGEILLANPSLIKMLGHSCAHDLLARDLASGGFEPSYPRSQFLRALEQGLEVRGLESAWTRADGTVLHVRESAHATRDSLGNILYFDGTVEDITERVRAEKALRESEATYRGLFDAVAEAIYIQDRSGRFLDVNQGAAAMYGYSREQLVGQTPELVSAPGMNDIPAVMERVRRAFEGEPQHFEFWGRRANGEVFPKEVKLYPGTYFGQQVVIALAVDVSERRRIEEARRQSQKLESLGVLAGGIAHDFNNLLTAILGNVNLAQMKLPEASPALLHLANAEKAVQRASELTKQMLAYSGRGRFIVHALDLNQAVQEMVHLLQVSISKKAALRFRLAPSQPAIQADAAQIQQVVMNLVTNASEAIGNSEGVITISTRQMELDDAAIAAAFPTQELAPGPYVVLEVKDTGCGMNPEIQTRIFDPFFTTKVSGRGLGLSAMLGILRGHRAGILIRSAPDRGSTFELFFPACEDTPAVREEADPEHDGPFTGTILLVDDEDGILESTSATLEGLGFRVISARDGVQALQRFHAEAENLRLVLMDLTMPRMDGATAFLAMQQSHPEIPVILSSGYDQQDFADELRDKGVAGFLQKPYRFKELRKVLRQVLAPSH